MKTYRLLFAFMSLLLGTTAFAQNREIYTNPEFSTMAKNHKVLAILPFEAKIGLRPNQAKNLTAERIHEMEVQQGLDAQSALYSYFLKEKGKDGFMVSFQDAAKTNALLIKNNITQENVHGLTPAELAQVLGVDAVITGRFETDKPMSDGASLALGLVVGFYGSTNSGKTMINIHDGSTGDLLWKYDKSLSRSLGSDTNTIITTIMRKASKKFPYSKV